MLQMRNLCNSRGWGRYVAEWRSLSRAIPAGRWADSSLAAGLTRPFGNVFMGESTVEKTPTSDWEDHHCRPPPPAPGLCSARPWQGRVRLASVDSTTMLTSRTSSLPPGSQSLHALPTGLLQPPRVFSLRRLRKQATSLAHTAPSGRAGTETQKAAVQGHGLTAPPHR